MHTHSLSIHPDSGRALRPWELALLLAVCVTLLTGTWAQARSALLASRLVRLHVIAVSDDDTEQAVKLQVRDAVLAYLEPQLAGVTDVDAARLRIADDLDGIARAAQTAASMFRSLGRRRTKRSSGPRKPPTATVVFPMSMVSSMVQAGSRAARGARLSLRAFPMGMHTAGTRMAATMASGTPLAATMPRIKPSTASAGIPWAAA